MVYSVSILLMRLNTRSLSALEAGIDDKIQYSGKHADAISYFVVSLDIDVCTTCL